MNSQFKKEMESLGVTPLGATPKTELEKSKPQPNNENSKLADQQVLAESITTNPNLSVNSVESGEELQKPGLATRDFRRLKQGKFYREAEIHLRGYLVADAIKQLKQFIYQSTLSGHRCIKIIHGKGINSPNGVSQVKLECQKFLSLNKFVLGYTRALQNDGGTGAKYVLLKKRKG